MLFMSTSNFLEYYEEAGRILTEADLPKIQMLERPVNIKPQCVVGLDCSVYQESTQSMEINIPIATARLDKQIDDAKNEYPARIRENEPCYRFILSLQPGTAECEPNTYVHYIARNGSQIRIILGSKSGVNVDPKDHTTLLRSTDDIDRKIIYSFLIDHRRELIELSHIQPSHTIYSNEIDRYMEDRVNTLERLQNSAILYNINFAPWRVDTRVVSRVIDMSKLINQYWSGYYRYHREDFINDDDWKSYDEISQKLDRDLDAMAKFGLHNSGDYKRDKQFIDREIAREEHEDYVKEKRRNARVVLR